MGKLKYVMVTYLFSFPEKNPYVNRDSVPGMERGCKTFGRPTRYAKGIPRRFNRFSRLKPKGRPKKKERK